jgi:hypothetical protein
MSVLDRLSVTCRKSGIPMCISRAPDKYKTRRPSADRLPFLDVQPEQEPTPMSKSANFEVSVLALILNATPVSLVADNTATTPLAQLFVALHTATPGPTGTQSTNEISYTSYARVAVARSNSAPAWTITGNSPASASPNAAISFASMTGGTGGTATYFSIGSLSTGAGVIYYYGTISPSVTVSTGVAPQLTTATVLSES